MLNQSLKLIRQQKPELLAVVGTTASGKSDLAIEIAKKIVRDQQFLGQYTGVDIINADSYSLYKKMDIGTAKPSIIERNKLYDEYNIKHLLFDILETNEIATAALFKNLADAEITKSQNARRLPILCGGSGLYIRAVTDNFEFSDGAKSMLERTQNKRHRGEDGSLPEYTYANPKTLQIAIDLSREELDSRIEKRTEKMCDAGLESEVRELWENGLLGETAIKAIGYAEFVQYFAGEPNPANGKPLEIDDVYELITMHTKRLVRRQQSWFKRDPRIFWL